METQTLQRQTLESLEEVDALQRGDRILVTYIDGLSNPTLEVTVQTTGTEDGPFGRFQFVRLLPNKGIRMYKIQRKDLGYDSVGKVLMLSGEVTTVRDYSGFRLGYPNLVQTIKFAGLDEN
ncbi:hypothetical protein A3K73_09110 [Candidatus Pacearchaeota archaeon RBG_13_36_9]|nr:MAG: hypothetical protein A3K73_09110 [Candidatus Pacearchaeota archaeon RBG_13_36_9]